MAETRKRGTHKSGRRGTGRESGGPLPRHLQLPVNMSTTRLDSRGWGREVGMGVGRSRAWGGGLLTFSRHQRCFQSLSCIITFSIVILQRTAWSPYFIDKQERETGSTLLQHNTLIHPRHMKCLIWPHNAAVRIHPRQGISVVSYLPSTQQKEKIEQ